MSPLKESSSSSDVTRPYRQYVNDMMAECERRMLPYPSADGGEATFGPAKRPLRAYAVRPEGGRMLVGIP